jgi:hypothetical protein
MQIRRSIILLVAVVVALIALVLWHGGKQPVKTPPTASIETNTLPPAAAAPSAPMSAPVHSNAPVAKMAKGADLSKSPPESKGQRMLEILSTANDVPIDFYGRVEDQFGEAVADATINFNVRVYNGYESTVKRGQVTADDNGFFSITGYKGQDLGLVPQKAGYALATTGTLFKYSHMEDHPYVSDQNNPTLIKMWKLQGAGPLVSIGQHYKLHYTDTPINFDLLAGKIVPAGGDIKLTVSRSPGIMSGRNRLAWSVRVEAVNGGVMDSGGQEAVTCAAPADGYEQSMAFMFSTNAPDKWFEEFNQGFFVTSRNGQVYGKLGLSFRINRMPDDFMYITFSGIASTNGSRNWEGDANTMQSIGQ